jgi:hypothetical protein
VWSWQSDRLNGVTDLTVIYVSTKKIKKEAFLLAFKVAFKKVIIKKNIYIGFRSTRLVLHNLEVVILKLNIVF